MLAVLRGRPRGGCQVASSSYVPKPSRAAEAGEIATLLLKSPGSSGKMMRCGRTAFRDLHARQGAMIASPPPRPGGQTHRNGRQRGSENDRGLAVRPEPPSRLTPSRRWVNAACTLGGPLAQGRRIGQGSCTSQPGAGEVSDVIKAFRPSAKPLSQWCSHQASASPSRPAAAKAARLALNPRLSGSAAPDANPC